MSKSYKVVETKKGSPNKVAPAKKSKQSQQSEKTTERRRSTHWSLIAVGALLAVMAVQMVWMARVKSATMDEQNHITRGVVYLRTGDLRLARVHPPLINVISALPLALDGSLTLPLEHPSWENRHLDLFASEFLWTANPNSHSIVFRARLPIIALTLLLGIVVYAWARELYGQAAGLLALTLFAFDPNVIAHGSLATNDLGLACFATLSLYTFWRWLRRPTWQRAVVASVAFGLAQASKFSAVFLIPAIILIALAHWLMTPVEKRPTLRPIWLLAGFAVAVITGAVIVWAIYGFQTGRLGAQGVTVPAADYLNEIRLIINRVGKGNPTFLLGAYSETGWWYYFPFAFLVKTPLPTLLLIGASFVYTWRQRTLRQSLALLIPVAIYFAISIASSLNIGYRHLLPALVLLIIFAAQVAQIGWHWRSKLAWGVAVLLAWLAVRTLMIGPDYLAYFNEAAGGPSNGYKVLVDSNLDWGQDLIGLREYMQREGIESVRLSYFGSADPAAYGIKYEPLPSYPRYLWQQPGFPPFLLEPGPGVYAISATNLQGALLPIHNMYGWFRERKPDAVIGHSIFVYRVRR
ncbi:MAG TPA: glycosyltransferase family 39 protein [Blastocatellia bacterium]|nr:glycosyltransferase family 39 protein [Blastocatellia bacterium]